MSDNKNEKGIVHSVYDGIEEHNNPLPGWWTWKFILTVIFAAIYFIHYQIADGPTLKDELKVAMDELNKVREANKPKEVEVSGDVFAAKLNDPNALKAGETAFKTTCASCHGENLQGGIGPNLTDKNWIHGGTLPEISATIHKGVPEKGMPPWTGVVKDEDITNIVVYIKSKRNTNPANAKKAEGVEVPDYFN